MSLENNLSALATRLSERKNEFETSQVYSKWEKDGVTWTIEDIHPEDDTEAVKLMMQYFIREELMCSRLEIEKDELSVTVWKDIFEEVISERTSLACYRNCNGIRELVGLNLCPVLRTDSPPFDISQIPSERVRKFLSIVSFSKERVDLFKELNVDAYLGGAGLFVRADCRGKQLGFKLLNVRAQLCKQLGVHASGVIFTSPTAQRIAERAGFETILEFSFADLAEAGYFFSGDQSNIMKLMTRVYS